MRSRARSHRNAKVLLALGAIIALIWTISLGASIYYDFSSVGFSVFKGVIQVHSAGDTYSILAHKSVSGWTWPHWNVNPLPEYRNTPSHWFLNIPLWPFALALLSIGAFRLYTTRPVKPGLCPRCRYDRKGLPVSSPCPECGEPSPDAPAR